MRPLAIVTGAGSGIGRSIAAALSAAGHDLMLVGRRSAPLDQTAALCSPGVLVHVASVARHDDVERMIDAAWKAFGRLDVLINNAGQGRVLTIPETTPDILDETMRTNALSAAWAIHHAWPLFQRQHARTTSWRGCVINISSMASVDPFPGFFAYAASKAAMNLLAASAAKEGASIGLRAFAIAPGAVETPMLRASFDESAIPKDQTLPPETIAAIVLQCIRGERDAQSGQVIHALPLAARAWFEQHIKDHPPIIA